MPQAKQRTIESGPFYRALAVREIDEDERTVEMSFSSEEPIERWFGLEILDHSPESVDLTRLNTDGPILKDHNWGMQIGVVEKAEIGKDRRGRIVARFGKGALANEVFGDIVDGIRKNVSVGYRVHKMILESEEDEIATYRITRWEPLEVSSVSIPADISVGVGRSGEEKNTVFIEDRSMPDKTEEKTPAVEDQTRQPEPRPSPPPSRPSIDVREVESKARKAETERVNAILGLGDQHEARDLARQFVENGKPEDEFRAALLEKIAKGAVTRVSSAVETFLDDAEQKRYSFVRAINALANPGSRRAQEAAAFEIECSQEASERLHREAKGLLVPHEVLTSTITGQRDLVVGTDTAGGHTVATNLLASSFIEMLRNRMVILNRATQLNDLVGDVAIPRQTGGATAYWVAESGAPTESQQAFDQVGLTPKTVGAFTDISRKLLLQSSLDVEAFVRNDLARTIAIELDRVAIEGSGTSNQPKGVLNTSGIASVPLGTDGGAPTWAAAVQLETEIAADNADIGALAYATNAKVRGKLKTTEKATGTAQFIWAANQVNGYEVAVTNQVPSDLTKGVGTGLSAMLFGNWADLVVGMWSGLDLTVDPYTQATSGTIRVVVLQDADMAVRHAESFAAITDMITA